MRRARQEAKSQNGVLASRYVALLGCMLAKLGCGCRHFAGGANGVETCILERIPHFGLGAAAHIDQYGSAPEHIYGFAICVFKHNIDLLLE